MALYTQTGSLQTYDAVEAAGPGVLVPDAQLLFTGDYSRAGSDLVLTGSDGAKFLVTGYFNTDTPPSLISPDGAKLPGDVVMSLAGPQFPGQYAQAGDAPSGKAAIGKVESSSGSASAVRTDGTTVVLKAGDPVFQGDVILTGPGSKLGISFVDGTIFSLSANARMVLNSLIYDPDAGQNNSMLFSLVEGSFVFAAGQIAPTGDMKIQTPVATMGIRGTAPTVNINSETGEVNFSIIADPDDGHVGTYTLYNLDNGLPIGTVSSVGTKWQLKSANGQIIEIDKTEADLLNDANAVGQINNIYSQWQSSTQQNADGPQAGPDNGPPPSGGLNTNPQNPDAPGADGNTGNPGGEGEGDQQPPPQGNEQQSGTPPPPPPTVADNDAPPPPPPPPPPTEATGPNIIDGDNNANFLNGTPGDDIVNAFGDNDFISAGPRAGFINQGKGDDVYNGGAGTDTLFYDETTLGVTIDLVNGTVTGPEIDNDTFTSIEKFIGGGGRDIFIVTEDGNWLFDGGDDIDTIRIAGDLNIDTENFQGIVKNVEVIDLNKTHDNVMTISPDDGETLTFLGGPGDTLNLGRDLYTGDDESSTHVEGGWRRVEDVTPPGGPAFAVYEFVDTQETIRATYQVELGIDVNGEGLDITLSEPGLAITGITPGDDALSLDTVNIGAADLEARPLFDIATFSEGPFIKAVDLIPDGGDNSITFEFTITVPDIPPVLDVFLLQDLSGSFGNDLENVRTQFSDLFDTLNADGRDANFGVGSFVDKPIGPFGSNATGDFVYNTDQALTDSKPTIQSVLNGLSTKFGGDFPESQIEALLQVAVRAEGEVGFRSDAQRFVVLTTDAAFHEAGDFAAPPNDADADLEGSPPGTGEDFPSVAQLKLALENANITPIFAVTANVLATYETLVDDLGRGFVVELTSNSSNITDAIISGLEASTFDLIPEIISDNFGFVSDIDPDAFLSVQGPDAKTFSITLTLPESYGNDDITIAVPGFGDVTINIDFPASDLEGSSFNDTLTGNNGSNIISGLEGDDIINGRGGDDTLSGGDGKDAFVFNGLDGSIDLITDYDFGDQDTLDLTGLLEIAFNPDNHNIDDFVQATTNGAGDTVISVDTDGQGPLDPVPIAVLQGFGAGFDVKVTIGDEDTFVTSAV